jgi:hypothetical protein
MQDRVESSTAAKHGTEKSRVGAEAQSPEALFHGAIVGVLLGREKGRNFNSSLQQVLLRRTGRPVVGWSGRGRTSEFGLTPAGFRVGVGALG